MSKIQELKPYTSNCGSKYTYFVSGPNAHITVNDSAIASSIAASLNAAYQLGYAERVLEENINIENMMSTL